MIKRFLSSEFARRFLTWMAAQYIKFVWSTGRWKIVGENVPDRLLEAGEPFIATFWHGRLIMMAFSWKRCDLVHMLISGHRDGQLVSGMMSHFGSKSVFGSSTRGGAAAFIQLVRLLKEGEVVGITPDGPRGPRMRANSGVVSLAKIAGAPIVPLTFSASWAHVFESWDRFMLPFPFSKGVFLWGTPIEVQKDADDGQLEEKRLEVEQALIALTQRADWLMNQADIEPASTTSPAG
ncbi:MAG: lysophospholipid acyltransferase family protein [Rickettsiales bacterium]